MAHSKQALKRHRQSEKKRAVNKNARTRIKSTVKKMHAAKSGDMAEAMKKIDKAAKVGAIHKNAASRLKSRLAKAMNKAKAPAK